MNVSQTTLTLAIALISVLSATAPVFKALLARSSTSFQLVRVSETHKLLVLAKNKGSRASYFRDATFVFEHHGNANQMLHIAEPDNERIIPPGSMKLFRLSVEPGWNSAKPGVPKEGDLLRDRFWIKARISGVWEGREPVVRADMADLTKVVKGRAF